MVLGRISVPLRDEGTEDLRKPHNEELHNLYSSPNMISIIKQKIRWAGHGVNIK
jgi:hypothetical protein